MLRRLTLILLTVAAAGCSSARPSGGPVCAPMPAAHVGSPAAFLAGSASPPRPQQPRPPVPDEILAVISTPRGPITCELFYRKAPLTVASFVGLAEGTLGPAPRRPFFNGLTFHRVEPGYVIQGGDPNGDGTGGPGYEFPDEFFAGERFDAAGVLAMARRNPDTNGSQFFITLGPARALDFGYSIFGRVVAGADVPARIERGDRMAVRIIRRGPTALAFRADDRAFCALLAHATRFPASADAPGADSGQADAAPGGRPLVLAPEPEAVPEPAHAPGQPEPLEVRLTNLELFTGRRLFLRVADRFVPDFPGQSPQAYADAQSARLHLPAGALLALRFAAEDRWYLGGAHAGLVLPAHRPGEALYAQEVEIISALTDQTDPR